MDKKSIIEMIKEETEKLRSEEYRFSEFSEYRDKIADLWECFCQRTEEVDVSEDDMRGLVSVLDFLTVKYYEALPQRANTAKFSDNMSIEEARENLNEMLYMCESAKFMFVQLGFSSKLIQLDRGNLLEKIEALKEKAATISEDEIYEQIVEAQTKDPWIFEVGASVSTILKFEELMGEHPEITEVLKENEDANNIYIIGEIG